MTPAPSTVRWSEDTFRATAEALPVLVWATGAGGRPDFLNAALREYLGHARAEDWMTALHPDDVDGMRSRWLDAFRRGEAWEGRCRLRRHAGDPWRWHALRIVPLRDAHGSISRWLGTLDDDHEVRRLIEVNQQLRASEERARHAAEEAGRMKDEFLATLAHELRSPLNAITGWTSLLKRDGLSPADQARALDVIERNALAQRHLIDDLLDASRVIAGHVRLDRQPVAIDDVVSQVVATERPVAEARGLHLDLQLASDLPVLWGDATRLRQVCANLLSNAVKFTPEGGTVRVVLAREAHSVVLEIADSGIGIPADFLPFVFDRFRQAESPAARRYGGLGLGLAMVRRLVEMHGGEVRAASAGEGHGARFTVTLPAADNVSEDAVPALARPPRSEHAVAPLRGQSILVIEDDADSREMLSVVLENAGGVPVGAASVTEGLRLLGDLQIDVVLSDIGLPGRDGFDLIRALRAFPNERVRRAPAIAVTAFTRAEDRARVLDAGFDAHVGKPVEPARLLGAIADVTSRRQP